MDLQRWTDPQAGARHMDMLQISRIGLDDRPDMFPNAPSDDAFSLAHIFTYPNHLMIYALFRIQSLFG